MKPFKDLFVLVSAIFFLSFCFVKTVGASEIVDVNDHLVCKDCYKGKDIAVGNAMESYMYNGQIETPNFTFIKEDRGSSCYGGGWNIVDKRVPNPELVPIDTECKEITKMSGFESDTSVFFKVTYYGGQTVVYEYKK